MSLAIITAFIISRNLLGPSGQQSSSARHSSVTVQSGAKTRWLRLTQGKNNNNREKKKKKVGEKKMKPVGCDFSFGELWINYS